jgi:hypothetical protein
MSQCDRFFATTPAMARVPNARSDCRPPRRLNRPAAQRLVLRQELADPAADPNGELDRDSARLPPTTRRRDAWLGHSTGTTAGGAFGSGAAQLDEMLGHRVSLLPDDARRLLEVIAVAGQPVPQELAAQAAGLQGNAEKALSLLRSCNLVRTGGMRPLDPVETYHDRIRETAARRLAPGQLRRVHERLAVSLETTNRPDPEALMVHWQGANKPDRAARYAAVAAARAAEALAFDRAADLFCFSLQRLGADDPARRGLQTQLGDALANAGRAPEAARAYLDAAVGASSPEGLELARRAAEQLLISGHSADGRRVAGSVLKAVGFKLPSTPQRAVLSLLLQRAKIRLRGVRFRERDESGIPEDTLRRIDTCWSMGIGLSMVDTTIGAIFTARYLLLSLAGGEPRRTARALAFEGIHRASIQVRSTAATRLIETARALAQRIGDPHVEGFTLLMGGVASATDCERMSIAHHL